MKDQKQLQQELPARLVSSKALRAVAMLAMNEGDDDTYMPLLRQSMEVCVSHEPVAGLPYSVRHAVTCLTHTCCRAQLLNSLALTWPADERRLIMQQAMPAPAKYT